MKEQNQNMDRVRLVHVGDREKAWDPEDPKIKYGSKPKGEDEDVIIHYVYNGEDGVIYPGDDYITSRGEAQFIIDQKTRHPEVWLRNKLNGKRERRTLSIYPPLVIEELMQKNEKRNSPIGIKLDTHEPVTKRPLPSDTLPEGYVIDEPPRQPVQQATLGPRPPAQEPAPIMRSELEGMSKGTLRTMLEQIGIPLEGKPSKEELIDMVLKSQEG